MTKIGSKRIFFLCVFSFAIISRVWFFYHTYTNFPDDLAKQRGDLTYIEIAKNLHNFGVYSLGEKDAQGNLIPTSFRTPVLPLLYAGLYAIVGEVPTADEIVRIIFFIMNIVSIFLVYKIGKMFDYYIGCIAALLLTFDLTMLWVVNDYYFPDTIFSFFMTMFLYYFLRFIKIRKTYKNMFLCSLFLGIALLTKPVAYLMVFPISIFLLVYLYKDIGVNMRRAVTIILLFVGIQVLFVGGWKMRNLFSTGSSEFTSVTGGHLSFTIMHLISHQEGISLHEAKGQFYDRYASKISSGLTNEELSVIYWDISWKAILNSPIDYTMMCLKGASRFLLSSPPTDFLYDKKSRDEFRREICAKYPEGLKSYVPVLKWLWSEGKFLSFVGAWLFIKAHLAFAYLLSLIGIIFMFRNKSDKWALIGMVIVAVYFIGISTPSSYARIRAPIMPVFYVLCAYAIWSIVTWWSKRRGIGGEQQK